MLAIDIETVPADPNADGTNPDFLDSRDFGLLGVGLFREEIDSYSEVRLLWRTDAIELIARW